MLNYYDLIGRTMTVQLNKPETEEATPESLRAAAKILEEKAKELDKPKVTPQQKAAFDWADKHGTKVRKFDFKNKKLTTMELSAKGNVSESYSFNVEKHVSFNDLYDGSQWITLRTYVDDCGDLETCVQYPY